MRIFDLGGTPETDATSRILTIPNLISFMRIAALPVIAADLLGGRHGRALVLLATFAATDWLDGFLARSLNQVSKLGQLLDPIADRALFVVVGISMAIGSILPWWAVSLILIRDVAVLGVGALLLSARQQPPAVSRIGKVATFGLMTALVLLLGSAALTVAWLAVAGWIVYAASIVAYWLAALGYARDIVAARDRQI